MEEKEKTDIIEQFLCEIGAWISFKNFIEKAGYTLEELGFNDE